MSEANNEEQVFRIRRRQHYVVCAEMDIEFTPTEARKILKHCQPPANYDWREDPDCYLLDVLHEISKERIESGKGYKPTKLKWYDRPEELEEEWDSDHWINDDGTEGARIGDEYE